MVAKDNRPGSDWWAGFKCRNKISQNKTEILENKRILQQPDPFLINGFHELFHETATVMDILDKPQHGFNLNETSFCRNLGNMKVSGAKVQQSLLDQVVMDVKVQLSWPVLVQTEKKLSPLLIFSAKNAWTSSIFVDGAYPGASYSFTKKGWMTCDLFKNWFEFHFFSHVKRKGHGSHLFSHVCQTCRKK